MLNINKILVNSQIEFETNFFEDYLTDKNFNDFKELLKFLDDDTKNIYISDLVSEYCDNNIDIYYANLSEWIAKDDNYVYFEQAVNEDFTNTQNFNYFDAIMSAQYLQLQEFCYNDIKALKDFINETYKF